LPIDGLERSAENDVIAIDQGATEFRLRGKVIVETGFRDVQFLCDVGVAEAVEAAFLRQLFGDVEDALLHRPRDCRRLPALFACHTLTLTY
jgi:hypothetical protein